MTTPTRTHRLSKSRFVAGCQCHKLLWWKVHEPNAEELQPDIVLQDRFDQGRQVGEMARDRFPGGVLIDFPCREVDAKIAATKAALEHGRFIMARSVTAAKQIDAPLIAVENWFEELRARLGN